MYGLISPALHRLVYPFILQALEAKLEGFKRQR
jgi:hypothetical protein